MERARVPHLVVVQLWLSSPREGAGCPDKGCRTCGSDAAVHPLRHTPLASTQRPLTVQSTPRCQWLCSLDRKSAVTGNARPERSRLSRWATRLADRGGDRESTTGLPDLSVGGVSPETAGNGVVKLPRWEHIARRGLSHWQRLSVQPDSVSPNAQSSAHAMWGRLLI